MPRRLAEVETSRDHLSGIPPGETPAGPPHRDEPTMQPLPDEIDPRNPGNPRLDELRREAQRLYDQLVHDRADIERRLDDSGRADPLKSLTGEGAMDLAVDRIRAMMARLDEAGLPNGVLGEPPVPIVRRHPEPRRETTTPTKR